MGVLKSTCHACGQEAKLLLKKQEKSGCIWLIPWWSNTYFVTCGNCFTTFKIDKELGAQIERATREADRSVKEQERLHEQRPKQLQAAQQVKRCSNCGSPITAGQRFCVTCGASLVIHCLHCGAIVSPGSTFCTNCSARLS